MHKSNTSLTQFQQIAFLTVKNIKILRANSPTTQQ